MADTDFVKVAEVGELAPGDMKVVNIGDDQILIVNVDGDFHAIDDLCSHAFASLADGDLNGKEVECPLHGSVFNVTTGEVMTSPADESQRVFNLRIEGQDIMVGPAKA
jgi:3-phenylpropionate/trans-cinnamate dioxygenase ferredoxin subunit